MFSTARGTQAATHPTSSGCSVSHSDQLQNQLLLVRLCSQQCALPPGRLPAATGVFVSQGNALSKALRVLPAQSAPGRLGSEGSAPHVGCVPLSTFPALVRALFQLPAFSRAPVLLHGTSLSLSHFFHMLTEMCFIFSQLLSFLLVFPPPTSKHQSTVPAQQCARSRSPDSAPKCLQNSRNLS